MEKRRSSALFLFHHRDGREQQTAADQPDARAILEGEHAPPVVFFLVDPAGAVEGLAEHRSHRHERLRQRHGSIVAGQSRGQPAGLGPHHVTVDVEQIATAFGVQLDGADIIRAARLVASGTDAGRVPDVSHGYAIRRGQYTGGDLCLDGRKVHRRWWRVSAIPLVVEWGAGPANHKDHETCDRVHSRASSDCSAGTTSSAASRACERVVRGRCSATPIVSRRHCANSGSLISSLEDDNAALGARRQKKRDESYVMQKFSVSKLLPSVWLLRDAWPLVRQSGQASRHKGSRPGGSLGTKNVKGSGMVDQRRFDKRSKSYGGAA